MWDLWDLLFFLLLLYIFFTLIMNGLLILYYIISIKWTSPTSSCKVPQAPQVLVRSHFLKNELTHTIFLVRSHKYVVALVINVRKKNINCLTSIVSLKTNWHTQFLYIFLLWPPCCFFVSVLLIFDPPGKKSRTRVRVPPYKKTRFMNNFTSLFLWVK